MQGNETSCNDVATIQVLATRNTQQSVHPCAPSDRHQAVQMLHSEKRHSFLMRGKKDSSKQTPQHGRKTPEANYAQCTLLTRHSTQLPRTHYSSVGALGGLHAYCRGGGRQPTTPPGLLEPQKHNASLPGQGVPMTTPTARDADSKSLLGNISFAKYIRCECPP